MKIKGVWMWFRSGYLPMIRDLQEMVYLVFESSLSGFTVPLMSLSGVFSVIVRLWRRWRWRWWWRFITFSLFWSFMIFFKKHLMKCSKEKIHDSWPDFIQRERSVCDSGPVAPPAGLIRITQEDLNPLLVSALISFHVKCFIFFCFLP